MDGWMDGWMLPTALRSRLTQSVTISKLTYLNTTVMCAGCKLVVVERRPINAVDFAHVTSDVVYR